MSEIKRLHWGCGEERVQGWINSDIQDLAGVDLVCDILDGLPLETGSIDFAVSVHALQEIAYPKLTQALAELRRVLKPGGVLRLVLPDLDKGIAAYQRGDRNYFLVPDQEATCLGGKFIVHMLWLGHSRSLFTHDFIEELLFKAGFTSVARCEFGESKTQFPRIVELDAREHESLFVEAVK
jgi:predicted SAM-dependent methyltransferase